MAWDRNRPVPWKRLFTFVGIYSLAVFGLFAILNPTKMLQSVPGLVFGAGAALVIMAGLSKLGWQPTMLKSKAQIAEAKAEREAARAAASGSRRSSRSAPVEEVPEARAKPAPTKRTTPGPTNHPRRTRDTRRR